MISQWDVFDLVDKAFEDGFISYTEFLSYSSAIVETSSQDELLNIERKINSCGKLNSNAPPSKSDKKTVAVPKIEFGPGLGGEV